MIYLDRHVMTPHEFGVEIERICEEYENKLDIANQYIKKVKKDIKAEARKWKDEEFEQLEEREKLVYGSFDYPQEMERWQAFCKKHEKCHRHYKIAGKIPYIIPYGTGIGTIYTAVCQVCGEKEDITYTEGW